MKLNMSQIVLQGSDASFNPQDATYSTLIVQVSTEKMAIEAFRQCRNETKCADQMLDKETLLFAHTKAAIDNTDLSTEQLESTLENNKAYQIFMPNYF